MAAKSPISRLIKVKDEPGLRKDRVTGTIVNVDKHEIALAKERKRLANQKTKEIEQLKNEVSEIKSILNKLIEKL